MHNFRELKTWQKAMHLVSDTYRLCKTFPKAEMYGLTQQLQRAAVSIPSNIAEGCGRDSDNQLCQYLDIANGSACEVETQILLAHDLNYINLQQTELIVNKIQEVQRMIRGFKAKIQNNKE